MDGGLSVRSPVVAKSELARRGGKPGQTMHIGRGGVRIAGLMSRILIAVSSPWAAQKVVEPVGDLAKRLGAEVLVVHVSRPSGGQMREQEQADGESSISMLRQALADKGIAVQTLLMFSEDIA